MPPIQHAEVGRRKPEDASVTDEGVMPVTAAHSEPIGVGLFDAADAADAAAELVPCCASKRWVTRMVLGRPYGTLARLTAGSDAVIGQLSWPDLDEALAGQARRDDVVPNPLRQPAWPRPQPSGTSSDIVRYELATGKDAYEQRFGHPFLICTHGLTATELLGALRSRLGNDPVAEREIVRGELRKITRLRLAQAFH